MVALLLFTGLDGAISLAFLLPTRLVLRQKKRSVVCLPQLAKETDVVPDTTTEDQARFSTLLSDKKTRLERFVTARRG